MAYAKIASVSKAAAGTSAAIDTTGADLIVICVSTYAAAPTPTDSKSNTYTALTLGSNASERLRLWYKQAPTVGTGHTFTVSTDFPAFFAIAFSGSVASPFDLESVAASATPGSITPSENNELVITAAGGEALSDPTSLTGGFTLEAHIAGDSSTTVGGGIAWLIQTTAAAANPTWTITNSTSPVSAIAAFKAAATARGNFIGLLGVS